jgi:hypothetical protein
MLPHAQILAIETSGMISALFMCSILRHWAVKSSHNLPALPTCALLLLLHALPCQLPRKETLCT